MRVYIFHQANNLKRYQKTVLNSYFLMRNKIHNSTYYIILSTLLTVYYQEINNRTKKGGCIANLKETAGKVI